MKDGVMQQVASPIDLYTKPCNVFVAGFIGSPQMNFINCKAVKDGSDVKLEFGTQLNFLKERQKSLLKAVILIKMLSWVFVLRILRMRKSM